MCVVCVVRLLPQSATHADLRVPHIILVAKVRVAASEERDSLLCVYSVCVYSILLNES